VIEVGLFYAPGLKPRTRIGNRDDDDDDDNKDLVRVDSCLYVFVRKETISIGGMVSYQHSIPHVGATKVSFRFPTKRGDG
jgi:hypothetical protein